MSGPTYDPNRGAPNGCLIVFAWAYAVARLALAGIGLILVIGYLLQSCGRALIHF